MNRGWEEKEGREGGMGREEKGIEGRKGIWREGEGKRNERIRRKGQKGEGRRDWRPVDHKSGFLTTTLHVQ